MPSRDRASKQAQAQRAQNPAVEPAGAGLPFPDSNFNESLDLTDVLETLLGHLQQVVPYDSAIVMMLGGAGHARATDVSRL